MIHNTPVFGAFLQKTFYTWSIFFYSKVFSIFLHNCLAIHPSIATLCRTDSDSACLSRPMRVSHAFEAVAFRRSTAWFTASFFLFSSSCRKDDWFSQSKICFAETPACLAAISTFGLLIRNG